MRIRYPRITVNVDAMKTNAEVLCGLCAQHGISVAGIIKFSDGDLEIAKAYAEGGCDQLGVSRARHLKLLKMVFPEKETLLTRSPGRCDLEATARWADISLHSDSNVLRALNDEAVRWNTNPGILLMLDVGDLREGVDNIPDLIELAKLVENLPRLRLRGIGTNLACLNGVLPTWENLSFLVEGAEAVEKAIGRKLELISGGSSINLLMLKGGTNQMPPRINHLRIGGAIANPMNIRRNRGVAFEGLREDTLWLSAEVIEVHEKASASQCATKNWAGEEVVCEDKGRRLRAILALGSQDVGDPLMLIPMEEGMEIIGSSSDHTVVDVTDSRRTWSYGDVMKFQVRYGNMLHGFGGKHVKVKSCSDKRKDQ